MNWFSLLIGLLYTLVGLAAQIGGFVAMSAGAVSLALSPDIDTDLPRLAGGAILFVLGLVVLTVAGKNLEA